MRVQSVTWVAVLISPSDPVSRAGSPSPLIPLPSREGGWRLVYFSARPLPLSSGLRIKSAMTGWGGVVVLSFVFGHGQVMVL